MENKLEYSFDDEVISKFCFNLDDKKIELHFEAYYDFEKNERVETPCVWIIESWTDAKSKIVGNEKFDKLEKHLGIFRMLLSLERKENNLEITVNTINNTYLEFHFEKPQISLRR